MSFTNIVNHHTTSPPIPDSFDRDTACLNVISATIRMFATLGFLFVLRADISSKQVRDLDGRQLNMHNYCRQLTGIIQFINSVNLVRVCVVRQAPLAGLTLIGGRPVKLLAKS